MRILGIDPGLRTTGYGCVDCPASAEPRVIEAGVIKLPDEENSTEENYDDASSRKSKKKNKNSPPRLPGTFSQFGTLLTRRWKIFFRDRTQVLLQVAILLARAWGSSISIKREHLHNIS